MSTDIQLQLDRISFPLFPCGAVRCVRRCDPGEGYLDPTHSERAICEGGMTAFVTVEEGGGVAVDTVLR